MSVEEDSPDVTASVLRKAGLPAEGIEEWLSAEPEAARDFGDDRLRYSLYWRHAAALVAMRLSGLKFWLAWAHETALKSDSQGRQKCSAQRHERPWRPPSTTV